MEKLYVYNIYFVFICSKFGYAIKTYNMSQHCDSVFSLWEEGIKSAIIQYNHKSNFIRDSLFKLDCMVEIAGWPGEDFILQFLEFDIKNWQMTFGIVQGDSWSDGEQIHGLRKQFSYFSSFKRVYTTKYWRIFIRLKGKPPRRDRTVFKLVLNTYTNGHCGKKGFKCQNGRCIDKSVKCNGYNPCGDSSDCLDGPHSQLVLILVGGLTVILLLMFSVCKVVIIRRQAAKKRRQEPNPFYTNRNSRRLQENRHQINHGNITVTYNLVGGNNTLNGPGSDVIVQEAAPPSYESVIAEDLTVQLNDVSDLESPGSLSDDSLEEYNTENQIERRAPITQRQNRPRASRYLPQYSEVLRNAEAYEVRTVADTET